MTSRLSASPPPPITLTEATPRPLTESALGAFTARLESAKDDDEEEGEQSSTTTTTTTHTTTAALSASLKQLEEKVDEYRIAVEMAEKGRDGAERASRRNEVLVVQLRHRLAREQDANRRLEETLAAVKQRLRGATEQLVALRGVRTTLEELDRKVAKESKARAALTHHREELAKALEQTTAQLEEEHAARTRAEDRLRRMGAVQQRLDARLTAILKREGNNDGEEEEEGEGGQQADTTGDGSTVVVAVASERMLARIEDILFRRDTELEATREELAERDKRIAVLTTRQAQTEAERRGKAQDETFRRKQAEKETRKIAAKLEQVLAERRNLEEQAAGLAREVEKVGDVHEVSAKLEHAAKTYKRRCAQQIIRRQELEARCSKLEAELQGLRR
jgi:chromosome segregation ATPase